MERLQLGLFDRPPITPQEASQQKAVQQGHDNASEEFKAAAYEAFCAAALRLPELSWNDVWPLLDAKGVSTHDNRAAGGVTRRVANAGHISKTDRTIKSARKTRNNGDVRVWRSNIYVGGLA